MTTNRQRLTRAVTALALSVGLVAASAGSAIAAGGDYTQVVCANPDTGAGVMASDGTLPAGFTDNSSRTVGPAASLSRCGPGAITGSRGVLLTVGVPFSTNNGAEGAGALTFNAPAGVELQNASLYWSADTQDAANRLAFSVHSGPWNVVYGSPWSARCEWPCTSVGSSVNPWAASNRVVFANPLTAGFSVTLACSIPDASWTCSFPAGVHVRVYGGKLALRDETNPQISGTASGPLMSDGVVRGTQDLTVNATDTGSGLYRVQLLADNVPALSRIIDANAGKCADVNAANADAYEFAHPVPCRLSAGGTYAFDTRQLPEGTHNLKILVEDAAGNSATVSNRNIVVDNIPDPVPAAVPVPSPLPAGSGGANATPAATTTGGPAATGDRGAPNGSGATDDARLTAYWAANRGSILRSRYGVRHVIRGRLTGRNGKGIANARVELAATPAARDARESLDKGGARTRPDGTWTLILPADVSSRALEVRYRSHAKDRLPAVTRTLRLKVGAGIRLSVTPKLAARGRTIRLAGRLLGRPVPRGGKVLELQARTPGTGWVTFATVRTDGSGTFAARYTFRRGGPVTYEMRVRSRASSDYPFDMGTSAAARVRVR
jgi:hypothetical protein